VTVTFGLRSRRFYSYNAFIETSRQCSSDDKTLRLLRFQGARLKLQLS